MSEELDKMPFIRSMFSGDSGVSFARVATAFMVISSVVWISKIVWSTNAFPAVQGIVFYTVTLYGINKAAEAAESFSSKQ